jgi:hypothetical protein
MMLIFESIAIFCWKKLENNTDAEKLFIYIYVAKEN